MAYVIAMTDLADVLPIYCGRCCVTTLFSCVADGKPLKAVVTLDGWLADVLANVADRKPL